MTFRVNMHVIEFGTMAWSRCLLCGMCLCVSRQGRCLLNVRYNATSDRSCFGEILNRGQQILPPTRGS